MAGGPLGGGRDGRESVLGLGRRRGPGLQLLCSMGKPICVPMESKLTDNQRAAIKRIAQVVSTNILSADPVGTFGEARAALSSKKFDYAGAPIEYMADLVASKVEPAWPRPGEAAIQPITRYLSEETKTALLNPRLLLLPPDKMPHRAPRSRVRATDQEWFAICEMAPTRGA